MTAVAEPTTTAPTRTNPGAGEVGLAVLPAAIVVTASAFVGAFAGHPDRLGAAYQPLMNAGVLLRGFGMFLSVVIVWGALRSRGASRPLLATAILSGPVAYGIVAAIGMLAYFPPGQAAYYGINPIFIATIGGQCAMAAVAEMIWRWRSRRRGLDQGRPITWRLLLVTVLGIGVVFGTVLYDGGVPFFYVYQRGYLLLFT